MFERRQLSRFADALSAPAIAAALSLVIAVPVLRLQEANWRVPFSYAARSDAFFYAMIVKTIAEDGDVLSTPALGAPFGLDLADFPLGADNLNYLILRILSVASGDWRLLINIFFVLTFPLAAASAAAVIRWFGVRRSLAVAGGVVFAFVPFHLIRAESHLFLSAYYGVPLGCWLAADPLRQALGGVARPVSRGWLAATAAAVVVAGSTGIYFAAFTLCLLAVAFVVTLTLGKDGRAHAARTALVAIGVAGIVVINLVPSVLYRLDNGDNRELATRLPLEAEILGLRLADMVLPVRGHRIDALADIRETYEAGYGAGGPEPAAIGAVPSIGVALAFVALGARFVRRRGAGGTRLDDVATVGILAAGAVLFSTSGGLGTIFSIVVSPIFRGWNRMSIVLAFLGIAAAVMVLERGVHHVVSNRPRRIAAGAAVATAVVLVAVALLDQVPSTAGRIVHADHAVAFDADRGVVAAVDEKLPDGAEVLQLPYVRFPENPPKFGMPDYEHLRGYLHADDLHWSYGAIKGRETDWSANYAYTPPARVATIAAIADFEGIWLDGAGYVDGGEEAEFQLTQAIGPPSIDGQVRFFDLRPLRTKLERSVPDDDLDRLRETALHPVQVIPGDGFDRYETDGTNSWRWTPQQSELTLRNPLPQTRRVVVEMLLSTYGSDSHEATVDFGNGAPVTVEVSTLPLRVQRVIEVPEGDTTVELSTTAPILNPANDPRLVAMRVADVAVIDEELKQFEIAAS